MSKTKHWFEERHGLGRIAGLYCANDRGILHVHGQGKETRYALRFFVGDCQGFCPRVGDEVTFMYRSFRAMEIKKLDGMLAKVISIDMRGPYA